MVRWGFWKNRTHNIGCTVEMAQRCPWVAQLSNGTRGDANPRRFRTEPATPDVMSRAGR